jgi:uncharacterized protein YecE (DUF72 family)
MTKSAAKLPGNIRLGTSSFSENDWVGPFYPPGTKPADFLAYYATRYSTVEVDATYYAVPSRRTVEGWSRKISNDFVLSAKFPRSIVHGGQGAKPDGKIVLVPDATYGDRDRFLDVMSVMGKRLGPLVLQFPYFAKAVFASSKEFMERLDRFLGDLPGGFRYGVEIRNRHWLNKSFVDLLRRHNAALVLVDQAWMPHGDEVAGNFEIVTSDFVYIRLLGDRREIEAITTNWDKEVIDRADRLQRWADLIARLVEREVETLIYVNNHYAGYAPATADRLHDMILEKIASS